MSWEQAWLDRVFWLGVVFVGISFAVFISDAIYDKWTGRRK